MYPQTEPQRPTEAEDQERSYLIVDPLRDMTCTVLERTLDLAADDGFTDFVEGKFQTRHAPVAVCTFRKQLSISNIVYYKYTVSLIHLFNDNLFMNTLTSYT